MWWVEHILTETSGMEDLICFAAEATELQFMHHFLMHLIYMQN